MSITERLYYTDSHLREFTARVIGVSPRVSGWAAVTLDRTAFYPTGGGQPSDTGTLNDARVVECIDEEAAGVLHVIHGRAPEVGAEVKGEVDWPRRLEHLQQHTGQHILSQAFVALFNAETRGFRMMEQASEIDIALESPTDERIERAVELANNIIWENRPVHVRQVTREEAATLPLRKDSAREGELRIIEIEGFDLSPCGGIHAQATGEVGNVAVRSWERAKGLTRIEFVAGVRAYADYNRANKTARSVAALFSVGCDEALSAAARLMDEHKQLMRHARTLEEVAVRVEAEELINEAVLQEDNLSLRSDDLKPRSEDSRLIVRTFENRDGEALRRLASSVVTHARTIALLGSRDGETARLVFARSADAKGDMNALMREACALLDGRGGGKPDMAQGGGRKLEKLEEALEAAARLLEQS
jgi:alanyl-tRNA synthetase